MGDFFLLKQANIWKYLQKSQNIADLLFAIPKLKRF